MRRKKIESRRRSLREMRGAKPVIMPPLEQKRRQKSEVGYPMLERKERRSMAAAP